MLKDMVGIQMISWGNIVIVDIDLFYKYIVIQSS